MLNGMLETLFDETTCANSNPPDDPNVKTNCIVLILHYITMVQLILSTCAFKIGLAGIQCEGFQSVLLCLLSYN